MSLINSLKAHTKSILTDVITVGIAVSGVIAILVNVAPSLHIPANFKAWLIGLSAVLATVIAEARRIIQTNLAAKRAAKKAAEDAASALAKAPAKRVAKRVAGK